MKSFSLKVSGTNLYIEKFSRALDLWAYAFAQNISGTVIITIFSYARPLIMRSINVLTINGEPESERDLIKIVAEAKSHFPAETWDSLRYFGKLNLEHDVQIATGGDSLGGFLFEKLTKRIVRIKKQQRSLNLLLGITPDPILGMYYFFDGGNFKRSIYTVHDYVTKEIGIVSLFRVKEADSSKVVAHGLGHSRGLRHHLEPVDLMYSELLKTVTLQVEGFCEVCLHKLTKD